MKKILSVFDVDKLALAAARALPKAMAGLRETSLVAAAGIAFPSRVFGIPATQGLVPVTGIFAIGGGGGVVTLTLSNPVAGPQSEGGQDGIIMVFTTLDTHDHIIKTGANLINGGGDTLTGAGAVGNCCILAANNGGWVLVSTSGFPLSEV